MTSSQEVQAVQDDIDLYMTLINSLGDPGRYTADDQDNRDIFDNNLTELRSKLQTMGNSQSIGVTDLPKPATQGSIGPGGGPSKPFLTLPSRKRERNELDDEPDTKDFQRIKSRKSSPAGSPAPSYADSVGSDFFDDPGLQNILGDDWRNQTRNNREYLQQQEAKKRQEEEDLKLAKQLQEDWSGAATASSSSSSSQYHAQRPAYPPAMQTQATFRPNGAFSKPAQVSQGNTSSSRFEADPIPRFENTPISVNSSDDDVSIIDPRDFNVRIAGSTPPPRAVPKSFRQPYPTPAVYPTSSDYVSQSGTSVYGRPQPGYSRTFLNSLPDFSSLNPLPALSSLLGSQYQPFDLESMTSAFNRPSSLLPHSYLSDPWATVDPKETQEEIRQLLHNIRPDEEIDISEASENQPEGLKVRLMPHQIKGLAWMKKMEDGPTKGGILADDMGLGKTVQAIALMLSRPPPPGKQRKPTLIVTPVALMEQWKREVKKMVRASSTFTVAILHGPKSHIPWCEIEHRDIVLTSYGTLTSELKRKVRWEEKLKLNPDAKRTKADTFGILDDHASFHRTFLDEAQWIKNRNTQAAAAACRIQSTFRWCLSGTPMQNGVDEIYSLIRFCRIRPYNSIEKFNTDIARPLKARHELSQTRAMEKLQALLKAILLRRTKKSEIDGKPILQLPEKRVIEDRAIFSKDQLEFYKALETQTQIQFNRFVKQGSVGRNYSKALVLLLRLRQCCCSPQLITNAADFITESGVEGTDLVANARELSNEVVARIKDQEDIECPVCFDGVENAIIFQCGHALCHECFSRMVDSVHVENADSVKCPHCRAKIDTKRITDHASFKEVYLSAVSNTDGENATRSVEDGDDVSDSGSEAGEKTQTDLFWNDSDDDAGGESDSGDNGSDLEDFIVKDEDGDALKSADESSGDDDDLDRMRKPTNPESTNIRKGKGRAVLKLQERSDEETSDIKTKKQVSRSAKSSGMKKKSSKHKDGDKKAKKEEKSLADLRKEGLKSIAAKKKYLRQLAKIYQPCAKIDKTLEILNEIHDRGENEKTIVFSSFTSFLDLIEVPLVSEAHLQNYARYDGSMTAKDRNDAVMKFTDDPNCRVILVSLKAGNAGLNLTVANHCMILDPFWNPFVEYQAADRCYRIGQKREVTVHRVLIGEENFDHQADPDYHFTVEDRILALQEKKKRLVESALDENASSSVGRLGIRELGYLFGVNEMPGRNGV